MLETTKSVRRELLRLTAGVPLIWLTGCGGGGDSDPDQTASSTDKSALAAADVPATPVLRRRARALSRRGVAALAVASDGTVAVATSDGAVKLYALAGGEIQALRNLLPAGRLAVSSLVFSGDGSRLIASSQDSTILVWTVASGQRLMTLHGHETALRAIAITPDGKWIVTAGESTRLLVWAAATGKLVAALSGHTDFVNALCFSSDGNWLASGDADARILLWRTANRSLVRTLLGHAGELNTLAIAPDDGLLASAGEDGKVLLWNPSTGQQVAALQGNTTPVRCLAFNSNGKVLAGGTDAGSLVIWRKATRDVLQLDVIPGGAVNTLQFDPRDANRLVVGSEDGQVRIGNVFANAGT